MTKHLAVWLDQFQARIFHVDSGDIGEATVDAPPRRVDSKHPHKLNDDGTPRASKRFLREVTKALENGEEVLVTGPSTTKHELFAFFHAHAPTLEQRVIGIASVTEQNDGTFLDYARQYFKLSDPMR